MKIAIAQMNVYGRRSCGQRRAHRRVCRARARRGGASLMVTPELAVCGYPPEDLLLRDDFLDACERAIARPRGARARHHAGGRPSARGGRQALQLGFGHAGRTRHRRLRQAESAQLHGVRRGALLRARRERRAFSDVDGVRFGVNICEDTWGARGPGSALPRLAGNVQLGINICADSWQAEAPRAARDAGAQRAAGAQCVALSHGQAARALRRDARARRRKPACR